MWGTNALSAPCVCSQFVANIVNVSSGSTQKYILDCSSNGTSPTGATIFVKPIPLSAGSFKISLQMFNKRMLYSLDARKPLNR